jgi:hypothetical protein
LSAAAGSLAAARLCRDTRGRNGGFCEVVATRVKRVTVERKGPTMSTTVLAYLILLMGFATFLAGAFGALLLLFEEVSKTGRVPFRYYAMMIGLLSGGLGLIGIGQGLRLLLLILGKE